MFGNFGDQFLTFVRCALPAYPWEPTERTPSGDNSDRQGDFS
jgi:hypothetical protein